MNKTQAVIDKATAAIEARGWQCTVTRGEGNLSHLIHLEITRGEKRSGWGLFEPVYCWTEAYERVTGRPWQTLIPQQ